MKQLFVIILLFSLPVSGFAQQSGYTDTELRSKLDSILVEGNQLYKYEMSAWISTDMAMGNPKVKERFEGYLTYEIESAIRTIILGADGEKCIASYTFADDFEKPNANIVEDRDLTQREKKLIEIREKIFEQLPDEEYDIRISEGYSLNFILMPYGNQYKFYIMTGTSQSDVIPFGNDYMFIADKDGNIESWTRFHTGLIPAFTKYEGNKVTKITHSHVESNPLISATDICSFMLYAPLYNIKIFSVYSGVIGKYMEYDLDTNSITVKDK